MEQTVTPNKCPRCPTCRRPLLYPDQCLDCGWEERPDFWDQRADVVLEYPRARDEGWGEAASSFVRDLDEEHMAQP